MSRAGKKVAEAALALVGAPFRLGGRDPVTGLDCIGLVVASLAATGREIGALPQYSLRQREIGIFLQLARKIGLSDIRQGMRPGDILLLQPSPQQFHLAIQLADGGIVHSHAQLRRVVRAPAPLVWPKIRSFRLR